MLTLHNNLSSKIRGAEKTGQAAFSFCQDDASLDLRGQGYRLLISRERPEAELFLNGRPVVTLNIAAGADAVDAFDERTSLGQPAFYREPEGVVVCWEGSSDRWAAKHYELRAWAEGFTFGYALEGSGALDRVHFWRTRFEAPAARNLRLFNPEPNSGSVRYSGQRCEPGKKCSLCAPDPEHGRPAFQGQPDFMTISVGRDKEYHDGNWFFTPAPFCYALEGNGNWLSMGIAAAPGSWNFTEMEYPGGGFGFSLVYDGHEQVEGRWQSPLLVCLVAPDEYAAVESYCDSLRRSGLAPDHGRGPRYSWWQEPIFCGWGEQVSQEVHAGGQPKAAERSTQANYEDWLAILEKEGVDPGMVVLDDKWQGAYGLNEVDRKKWPDLPGFVERQRRRGRYVLLWLKAWDPEGLPAAECILDASGQPLTADPGNPLYRERLAGQVRRMLFEYGADGFKLDFTHLTPRGPLARYAAQLAERNRKVSGLKERPPLPPVTPSVGGKWGLELLRQWLEIISQAAREAKPDALVIAHTANPYLANLVDMLRLNDIAGLEDVYASVVPAMRHRSRIARSASPYWLLDSDNWPCSTREQWRDYIEAQAGGDFGIPALYHAARLGWGPTDEALQPEDYAAIRRAWSFYRQRRSAQALEPAGN